MRRHAGKGAERHIFELVAKMVAAELGPVGPDYDRRTHDITIDKALRITGYDAGPGGDHCAHGFRSSASTLLNAEGAFDGDVVEAQLAHETGEERGGATTRWCGAAVPRRQEQHRGICNGAAYWSERVRLMQHWANRLDRLREGVAVPLRKSA